MLATGSSVLLPFGTASPPDRLAPRPLVTYPTARTSRDRAYTVPRGSDTGITGRMLGLQRHPSNWTNSRSKRSEHSKVPTTTFLAPCGLEVARSTPDRPQKLR